MSEYYNKDIKSISEETINIKRINKTEQKLIELSKRTQQRIYDVSKRNVRILYRVSDGWVLAGAILILEGVQYTKFYVGNTEIQNIPLLISKISHAYCNGEYLVRGEDNEILPSNL